MGVGYRRFMVGAVAAVALGMAGDAAAQVPCPGHTTVRSGDTLVSIAARCGVSVPALLAANPAVHGNQDLQVGRDIAVPHPRDREPTPQQACGAFYTVRSGDTVAGVAMKCGLTVPLLVAANGPLPRPLGLHAGSQIRIPNLPRAAVRDTLIWLAEEPTPEPEPVERLEELSHAVGVLAAGTPCMLLRADDGRTIALAGGPTRTFRPGDRVAVLGVPVGAEACGRAPALDARIIYRPE